MKTYELREKILFDNDSNKVMLVLDCLKKHEPENRLRVDDKYVIYRFVVGKMLYYVHFSDYTPFKICVYEEVGE